LDSEAEYYEQKIAEYKAVGPIQANYALGIVKNIDREERHWQR
jgi:hypothetical protein